MKTIEQILTSRIGKIIKIETANLWKSGQKIKPVLMRYKVDICFPNSTRPLTIYTNNVSNGLYWFLLDRLAFCRKYNFEGNISFNYILSLLKELRT